MDSPTDDLLRRAVEGDDEALQALLRRFGPEVRRSIAGTIKGPWRSKLDEDDVMQVAYLEAFLHLEELVARDAVSFVAWLRRIAVNTLRNAIRELERDKRPPVARRIGPSDATDSRVTLLEVLARDSETPSRAFGRVEAGRVVDEALEALPRDYRTVVRLVDLEGASAAEAAVAMDRSVGAVYMLRARAHERMRAVLGSPSGFLSDGA